MSCDCKVKPQYRGKSISFVGGGLTLVFPLDGSNPYDEKTCEKYPKFFECLSDSKPARRKSRKAYNGVGDSRVQGNKVDKVGRGRKRRAVSTEDSGSVSEQQNAESSPNTEEQPSGIGLKDGEREPTKED
jgi:hypothetical protein